MILSILHNIFRSIIDVLYAIILMLVITCCMHGTLITFRPSCSFAAANRAGELVFSTHNASSLQTQRSHVCALWWWMIIVAA